MSLVATVEAAVVPVVTVVVTVVVAAAAVGHSEVGLVLVSALADMDGTRRSDTRSKSRSHRHISLRKRRGPSGSVPDHHGIHSSHSH